MNKIFLLFRKSKLSFSKVYFPLLLILCSSSIFSQSSTISNSTYSNNGTFENSADDYVLFKINPVAPVGYYVAPYSYAVTATFASNAVAVTLLDNTSASNVSYGISTYFKIVNGALGSGDFTITITPNWGSFTPETLILANPGTSSAVSTSSSSNNEVNYYYYSPSMGTDLTNAQGVLPKFDEGTTRHLTKVKVEYGSNFSNGACIENNSNSVVDLSFSSISNLTFSIGGFTYNTTQNLLKNPLYPGGNAISMGINVPAQGDWLGDVLGTSSNSTLMRMLTNSNFWLHRSLSLGLDPTLNPNWVSNVTGNPTTDDDILVLFDNNMNYNNSVTYTATADLNNFKGTSSLPASFSTMSGSSSSGGGNITSAMGTRTSFYYKVTYTYDTDAPIIAQDDSIANVDGATGNPNAGNVFSDNGNGPDTLNGVEVTSSLVDITITTPASSIEGAPVPVLDAETGQISVPSGTPAGIYTIIYTISVKSNPVNSRSVKLVVKVDAGNTLAVSSNLDVQKNMVLISVKDNQIAVNSLAEKIQSVAVYSINGKQLFQQNQVNSNELHISALNASHGGLIVKTTLQNGKTVSNKIMY